MISVSNLEKTFADRTLFAGASFQLNPGERYGLIGANGSGKTTLLNILSGDLEPSAGTVSIPGRLRLGVLRQDQFAYEDQPILSVVLMGVPELWHAMEEKEALLARAEDDFDADRFSELEEIVQAHDGYTAEARAAVILEGLGLPENVHRQPLSTLSGGFKLRVLLAQALASQPDVLLLDEPTNHLDILSIRWLEKFLRDFAGPVVVISHDHRFLDNVCTHTLDVDYQTVELYPGNYTRFLEAKAQDRERREHEIAKRQKEIDHHQKFVDRFRAKASKARQAQSKLRLIEKKGEALEELPTSSRRHPTFRFETRRSSGREVLTVDGVSRSFGDKQVLHDVSLDVVRGDRLAIMGPNGIGKSTLLKIIMADLEAEAGEVTWGYETHVGYFAQDHHDAFEGLDQTAQDWLATTGPTANISTVRGAMGLVLFSGDDADKRLKSLSGGEAARLVFCKIALERPNVLVLDEPTNHLDLESIEALVEGLKDFAGTLVFVSHDRWFVGQLANRVIEITPEQIRDYRGTYQEYVHHCGDDHLDVDTVVLKAKRDRKASKTEDSGKGRKSGQAQRKRQEAEARKQAGALRRRLREVTAELETWEAKVSETDEAFARPDFYDGSSPDEIRDLQEARAAAQERVETLMEEWEDLERQLQGVEPGPESA